MRIIAMSVLVGITGSIAAAEARPELASPRNAARVYFQSLVRGDAAGARSACVPDPKYDPLIDALAMVMNASKKLSDAAIGKFGDAGKGFTGDLSRAEFVEQLDRAEVTIDKDSATIRDPMGGPPMKLKLIDGNWKVDVPASVNSKEDVKRGSAKLRTVAKIMDGMAGEIKADKYTSADQARQVFDSRVNAAMAMPSRPMRSPTTMPAPRRPNV